MAKIRNQNKLKLYDVESHGVKVKLSERQNDVFEAKEKGLESAEAVIDFVSARERQRLGVLPEGEMAIDVRNLRQIEMHLREKMGKDHPIVGYKYRK